MGINQQHPEFKYTKFIYPYDCVSRTETAKIYYRQDGYNHGTEVCGVIAASINDRQIAGLAPNVSIMPICHPLCNNMSKEAYQRMPTDLAIGIMYAVIKGADIINCSWGDDRPDRGVLHSAVLEVAIEYALNHGRNGKGCVVVFASGNRSTTCGNYPARCFSDVLTVGAIDRSSRKASLSSYGTTLDVVAPGQDIYTTDVYGGYSWAIGTSFACPHVSAVAALMLSVNPNLTQKEVANIIESTAQKIGGYNYTTTAARPNGTWNIEMGYGLLNAYAAVQEAKWQQLLATERRMMEYLYATGPLSRQILSRYVTLPALPASAYITTATVSFMPRRRTFQTATSLSEKDTIGQIVPVIGKPRKIMENGQVYILKDGAKYDLSGRIVESR